MDKDGNVSWGGTYARDGRPRSPLYSQQIDQLIASPKTARAYKDDFYEPSRTDGLLRAPEKLLVDSEHGGGVTVRAPGGTRSTISGRDYSLKLPDGGEVTLKPPEILMHELALHAAAMLGKYTPPGVGRDEILTGSVTPFENRMRAQLGLAPRPLDPLHGYFQDPPPRPASPRATKP
jgi:hypothetical protein